MLILSQNKLMLVNAKKVEIKKVNLYREVSEKKSVPYDRFRVVGDAEFVLGDYYKLQTAQKILSKIGQAAARGQLYIMPKDFYKKGGV